MLAAQIVQTERLTGATVEQTYADRGYRGHGSDRARVFIGRQKRSPCPRPSGVRRHAKLDPRRHEELDPDVSWGGRDGRDDVGP